MIILFTFMTIVGILAFVFQKINGNSRAVEFIYLAFFFSNLLILIKLL